MSICVCVTLVVLTDCESYTTPITTNPGSTEAGDYRLTRGTWFVADHLEVVAIAGLLWIPCVLGKRGFQCLGFVFVLFERTRPASSMRTPCLLNLSTSNEAVLGLPAKKPLHTRVRTG